MTRTEFAKKATSAVVSFSVGRVISAIIHNNVPVQTVADKVAVETGSFVLGGMAATHASQYTDQMIDDVSNWWKTNVTKS